MKYYKKTIDGKAVIKTRKDIIIRKDGKITINPTEDMILADEWVEYIPPAMPELTDEQKQKAGLTRARHNIRNEIVNYDKSVEVKILTEISSRLALLENAISKLIKEEEVENDNNTETH